MPRFLPATGYGIVKRWLGSPLSNTPFGKKSVEISTLHFTSTSPATDISSPDVYEQQSLIEEGYVPKTPDGLIRNSTTPSELGKCAASCFRSSHLFRSHIYELIRFSGWLLIGIPSSIQLPFLWYVFWKYICTYGTVEVEASEENVPLIHLKRLYVWLLWVLLVAYYRKRYHKICPSEIVDVVRYIEFFAFSGLIVTLSANICSLLHTPAQPLYDLGFSIVPAQTVDSPWRPVSDILAQALPVALFLRCAWLRRATRCQVLVNWLRCVALAYFFRALTVTVTSLPGPAPHCNDSETYNPPAGWHDIATRLGPMVGDYSTCGDLIFSGHTAFTNTTMLCLVKTFKGSRWDLSLRILGPLYVLTMATMALAGRKHYSVDIIVALLVSTLTFYRFQDGWVGPSNHMTLPSTVLAMTRKDTIDLPQTGTVEVQRSYSRQSTSSRIQLV